MAYLVGIDSGGTHTNIRILTPDGAQRSVPEISRSLTSNRSDAELRSILEEIFSAVQVHTLGQKSFVWISAAGYAHSTRERFLRLLKSAVGNFSGRIGIANDAVTLLLAHVQETVIVIAGTGSASMALLGSGKVITRGGDEWVAADFGSAFWIGLNGIRAAYRAVEGGDDTALRRSLAEHYLRLKSDGEREERLVIGEIVRRLAGLGTDTKPVIASFAGNVTRQAELGDEVAQTIVRHAVEDLAAAATRVYRELAEHARPRAVPPRFLINGSVAARSPFYSEAFRASLNQNLFDVRQQSEETVEVTIQLNGTSDAIELTRQLESDMNIPDLGDVHSHLVIDC